ncbi:MAG: OmpA family protein [Chitinispirillaceae bacterium]|nr:OmpA family protein [Chitinispirillaceae bacterium]
MVFPYRLIIVLTTICISIITIFAEDSIPETSSAAPQLLHLYPAATLGPKNIRIGITGIYGFDNGLVLGTNGTEKVRRLSNNHSVETGWAQMLTEEIDCRYGIHRMVDISLKLPVYTDITGWGDAVTNVGDLSISGTFLPLPPDHPFRAGVSAEVIFPTGNHEQSYFPRHVYYEYSDPANTGIRNVAFLKNRVYFHPVVLFSLDVQRLLELLPLSIHLNAGCVTTGVREAFSVDAALGLAIRPVSFLQIAAEIAGEVRPLFPERSLTQALVDDPLRCVPSLCLDLPAGFSVLLAGEFGVANGSLSSRMKWIQNGYAYATKAMPNLGTALSVIYNGSIRKKQGSVPAGQQDSPAQGQVQEATGDRDRDGIPDSLDRCPETPEDLDKFQNEDGCPDYDNDSDQVVDELDGCPDNPEDKDGFEDTDGCPDFDNDGDQVPDTMDACPDDKGIESNRGCPEDGALPFVRTALSEIAFAPQKSKIVAGQSALDRIAKALKETPKAVIEIQVHTDNIGAAALNLDLSKKRADMIKLYLVSKGIRGERINALGLGSEFPIADNSSKEGRAKNQRVEIRRIE